MDLLMIVHPYSRNFRLFLPTGEKLEDYSIIADVLRDFSKNQFQLRFAPPLQQIQLSSVEHPDIITFDVDFYVPTERLLARFCRKLGRRLHTYISINIELQDTCLDITMSLNDLNIERSTHLVLVTGSVSSYAPTDSNGEKNIWDEPDNEETFQSDSQCISGTLNKLCERLTSENNDALGNEKVKLAQNFMKTFLVTYPSFTTSANLLEKLMCRYDIPNMKDLSRKDFEKYRTTIQIRTCNVILIWTKKYPAGFIDPITGEEICDKVIKFLDEVVALDYLPLAKQIRRNVASLKETGREFIRKKPPFFKSDFRNTEEGNSKVLSYTALEIAEQLTIIEWYYYSCIMV